MRLFPRATRPRVNSSGVIAWHQLSAFVRATMIVAFVDAVGISVGAAILKVPFAFAIGILVFILAFIPIVGALLSGAVAVLLALVAHGPGVALIMLAVVIGVQQLESHVLQPFLLGKAVSVHPLAVILAIATGSIIAGIVGALVAVPFAAVLNAVGKHLFSDESQDELDREMKASADEGRRTQPTPDRGRMPSGGPPRRSPPDDLTNSARAEMRAPRTGRTTSTTAPGRSSRARNRPDDPTTQPGRSSRARTGRRTSTTRAVAEFGVARNRPDDLHNSAVAEFARADRADRPPQLRPGGPGEEWCAGSYWETARRAKRARSSSSSASSANSGVSNTSAGMPVSV